MLDLKRIRENVDGVIKRLNQRGEDFSYLHELVKHDEERREIISALETLKAQRNATSKSIGKLKREGKDIDEVMATLEHDKVTIQQLEKTLTSLENSIEKTLLMTPNIPHENIPIGKDEDDNPLIKTVGDIPKFTFEVKPHWELGPELNILDFDRATKMSASRFTVYKGLGARLERALIQFMMDLHSDTHGYTELILPYIINRKSMVAAGQFPKFEDDAFKLVDDRDLYLNPTAEVPSINMHRDEILTADQLPIRYVAFTTAFRQEAGSAGRDTRGIIRQHQFNKVELIQFTTPEQSYEALDCILASSEQVLKQLKLPYRVVELCSGDIGFAMAKTYDIEVYIPAYKTYREIGSISNAEDYQARRANIKYRPTKDAKPEFVHTLNGSGLAVGRTVVAILENYQQEDGSVKVPEVLIPYMKIDTIK